MFFKLMSQHNLTQTRLSKSHTQLRSVTDHLDAKVLEYCLTNIFITFFVIKLVYFRRSVDYKYSARSRTAFHKWMGLNVSHLIAKVYVVLAVLFRIVASPHS